MVDCRRGNDDGSDDPLGDDENEDERPRTGEGREACGTGSAVVVTIIVAAVDLKHRRPLLLELPPLKLLVLPLFFRVGGGTTTEEFSWALKGGGAS